MKNIAVICEYNPFHNGHLYQINRMRETFGECRIICIMSGNYVQRGEPAVLDKYTRAELAVENGVDLVLELVPPYCFAPAEIFARAGVHIADSIGADTLVFGSECGDTTKLKRIADNLNSPEFNSLLDRAVSDNTHTEKSYIRIRSEVYESLFGDTLPDTPNDILALEYIASIGNTKIKPYAINRLDDFSAADAREALINNDFEKLKEYVPDNVYNALAKNSVKIKERYKAFEQMIFYKLLSAGIPADLSLYEDCETSLLYRVYDASINSKNLSELISQSTSKKYTASRIKRLLLNILFGIRRGAYASLPAYTNVLGANDSGRRYLREISKTAGINVETKPPVPLCDELYSFASGDIASDSCRKKPYIK